MPVVETDVRQATKTVAVIGHNYYKTRAFVEYLQKMLGEHAKVDDVYRTYHAAAAIEGADIVIGTGWSRTTLYDGSSTLSLLVPYSARLFALKARKPYLSLRRAMAAPYLVERALGLASQ